MTQSRINLQAKRSLSMALNKLGPRNGPILPRPTVGILSIVVSYVHQQASWYVLMLYLLHTWLGPNRPCAHGSRSTRPGCARDVLVEKNSCYDSNDRRFRWIVFVIDERERPWSGRYINEKVTRTRQNRPLVAHSWSSVTKDFGEKMYWCRQTWRWHSCDWQCLFRSTVFVLWTSFIFSSFNVGKPQSLKPHFRLFIIVIIAISYLSNSN